MTAVRETDVVIVGAGPVGLTLGMILAQRGVAVTLLETRHRGEPPNVKCNHVSARSMEILRRLGVANAARNAGLPADYANDIAYRTSMVGKAITRIPIPCRRDRFTATGGPDTDWPTAEPPHRINQLFLEPILFEHAVAMPGLTVLNRTEYLSHTETADGIQISARNIDSGEQTAITARYLAGCDGGRSQVRRDIGAKLVGDAVVQRVQSTYIRAPQLLGLMNDQPAWASFSLNPRRSGNVYAIDGRETWLVHNYLRDDEPDFDSVDRDWSIREILGVGPDFTYEVLSNEDWFGRRLVADRFHQGRVFICGDAAHLWVPYAGYGMNAGIADAECLGWLLAANVAGWGKSGMLDAYAAERQPITEQVSVFAMNHAHAMAKERKVVPADIEDDTPTGAAAREALGRKIYDLNVQQYCCGGLNFGYYYDRSPIISYDGAAQPAYSMADFTPSTVPGCRTPHIWLADKRSLYDAMGPDYTLLRFDTNQDAQPLMAAAAARGIPIQLLDVAPGKDGSGPYAEAFVLSRPDRHVAWRGDACPTDPNALLDTITGTAASAN
jgi:2-polyprenyl-6-methoxyphenol hydroxylase-like FAD-dependent oxidoreductase